MRVFPARVGRGGILGDLYENISYRGKLGEAGLGEEISYTGRLGGLHEGVSFNRPGRLTTPRHQDRLFPTHHVPPPHPMRTWSSRTFDLPRRHNKPS